MTRFRLSAAGAVLCALALPNQTAFAGAGQYVETFNTTTYKDPVSTTANWDTGTGQLKLFDFNPSLVGSYNTSGFAVGVTVAGDLAYVADWDAGLRIVDITNPTSPTLVGTYNSPGTAFSVVVDGDLAFVADGASGLRIVNIANPASPTLTGFFNSVNAGDVAVAGDLAFVADGTAGLRIVNIINPASPTLVSSFNTPGLASGVAVDGDLVYIADDSFGLRIVNILNPAVPTFVGAYDTPGLAIKVSVTGDLVLVADTNSGVQLLNIANPASPVLLGTYDSPGIAIDVDVTGDVAFVADDVAGLQIVDIRNPASPTLLKTFDTSGLAFGVAVAGEHAFVADEVSGLHVIEVATPALPRLVGTNSMPFVSLGVAVDGDLAVVADGLSGLKFIDTANPANPTLVGMYDTPGNAQAVAIAGDLAFAADAAGGLQIISIVNPASPALVGTFDTPGIAIRVAVAGDLVFVADGSAGLQIVNITNPASPALAGAYDTPGNAQGVATAGDLAFVADATGGLQIINIVNPASPSLVGNYDTPGSAMCVAVAGDLAFEGDDTGGLQVINITNPASPTLVGTYDTSGNAVGIAVEGDFAFVADNTFGLQIISIVNPATPALVDTYYDTNNAQAVAVAGGLALVADNGSGLHVIEVLHHRFYTRDNIGRSLALDATSDALVAARLTTTQAPGVAWEISADAGATWQAITPNNAWTPITNEGSDLQWRSTHSTTTPTVNPTASDLQIEWLYEFALIDAITDIPADQGGWVRLRSTRSGRDFAAEPLPIVNYGVWRRVDDAALVSTLASAPRSTEEIEPAVVDAYGALPIFGHHGDVFVQSTPRETTGTLPPGTWALVANIPALQQQNYVADIPTLADSTMDGVSYSVFVVTAHTTTPSIWYASSPDSGYSVDNIAPGVPTSFAVAYNTGSGNALSWDPSPEEDFQYFRVYRSTDPGFAPSPATLVHETASTDWSDPDFDGSGVYYKLTALDHAGNESDPATAEPATSVGGSPVPERAALYQNHPNPFNPTTQIRFDVPRGGADVHLAVYDVSGRLVRALVSGREAAGQKSVDWDGRDDAGTSVATGVYFYRASIGTFTSTRKMMLLK